MDRMFWQEKYESVKVAQRQEWWVLRTTRLIFWIVSLAFGIAFVFDSAYWFIGAIMGGLGVILIENLIDRVDKENEVERETWEMFLRSLDSGEDMTYD